MDFAIVIPTFNRTAPLARCLQAVAHLSYPLSRVEVIVVDDGGSTALESVIDAFRGSLTISLKRQENAGPAKARNTGAAAARARFLAFIDDDCMPEPDWLTHMSAQLEQTPDRLVGGRTVNALPDNIYSTASELITGIVYAHYNASRHDARFLNSTNMAMGARLFSQVGGFDESFTVASEDREFCDRWRHRGNGMTYLPDAVVRHAHAHSLASFCTRHFVFGRGAAHYHRVRGRRGSGRMRDEMGFHANVSNWALEPLQHAGRRRALPIAGLLILWQCFNAAGFAYEFLHLALSRSR